MFEEIRGTVNQSLYRMPPVKQLHKLSSVFRLHPQTVDKISFDADFFEGLFHSHARAVSVSS